MISAPDRYELSHLAGSTSGPISAAQFDDIVGQSGAAVSLHFVGGYLRDYDSTVSPDSVFVALYQFSSPAAAAAFLPKAVATTNAKGPVRHDYAAIPTAVSVDGTESDSDGFRDHAVLAVKASVVMSVEVLTKAAGPAPELLAALASQQYRRL